MGKFKEALKKINIGKVLKPVAELVLDGIPFAGSAKKVVSFVATTGWKKFDKNQDGKVTLEEVPWVAIAAVLVISVGMKYGFITKETLLFAADLVMKMMGQ